MNEFIVWDKVSEQFGKLMNMKHSFSMVQIELRHNESDTTKDYYYKWRRAVNDEFELFQYIGKKDINDKKIYADCSIVEFEYEYLNGHKEITQGYLSYCNEHLAYMIENLNPKNDTKVVYWRHYMGDFKIIDTIQENKLGLVK